MINQVFSISQTENMILARINGKDLAYTDYVKGYVQKNFKFFIYLQESILVFPKSEDIGKRRFFLSCLQNNFNKAISGNEKSFDFNLDLPFFIEFAESKEFSGSSKVLVNCHRENVFFRFSDETYRVVEFLRKNFGALHVEVDYSKKIAKVPITCQEEFNALRGLLSKNIKIGSLQTKFTYNEEELIRLHISSKNKKRNGGYSEFEFRNTVNRYFSELNSKRDDSFDVIKRRYYELVKIYHPDRVHGEDPAIIKQYTTKFIKIREAFEFIKRINRAS